MPDLTDEDLSRIIAGVSSPTDPAMTNIGPIPGRRIPSVITPSAASPLFDIAGKYNFGLNFLNVGQTPTRPAVAPAAVPVVQEPAATAPSVTPTAPPRSVSGGVSPMIRDLAAARSISGEQVPMPTAEMPEYKPRPPLSKDQFLSIAGMSLLFAALAGRSTRDSMTSALNAFSSGIKGYMEGDKEMARKNIEDWKNKTESALNKYNIATNKYKMLLEDKNMRLDEKWREIDLEARKEHDQMVMNISKEKNAASLYAHIQKQQEAITKLRQSMLATRARLIPNLLSVEQRKQADELLSQQEQSLQGMESAGQTAMSTAAPTMEQVIERGGRKYRVVGHDTDGTPLVEPM